MFAKLVSGMLYVICGGCFVIVNMLDWKADRSLKAPA